MTSQSQSPRTSRMILWRRSALAALAALAVVTLLFLQDPGTRGAAAADPASQCVTCHTDAAKLKALTPPDPPAAEEAGEG